MHFTFLELKMEFLKNYQPVHMFLWKKEIWRFQNNKYNLLKKKKKLY